MRHTRMRQIAKAHGEEEHFREWRDEVGTDPIDFIRYCKSLGLTPQLDSTFKWHREPDYGDNWIELGGDGYRYGVLLEAKACYKTLKGLTK